MGRMRQVHVSCGLVYKKLIRTYIKDRVFATAFHDIGRTKGTVGSITEDNTQ